MAGLCPGKKFYGMLLFKSGKVSLVQFLAFEAFLRVNEANLGNEQCRPAIGSWLPGPKSASKVVVIRRN